MNKIKLVALLASSTVLALGLNCIPNIGGTAFQDFINSIFGPIATPA